MNFRNCGNTNLKISEIGLGTATIGNLFNVINDQSAVDIVQTAYELGVRYFDTSSEYGHGLAEIRLGQALRKYERDTFVISTKVGDLLQAKHNCLPPESKFVNKLPFFLKYDYSYNGIMRSFEDSLQRLGFNRVDIVYVHDLDPHIHKKPLFEKHLQDFKSSGYKALKHLKDQGVVQAIGLGVRSVEVCILAMEFGDYDCFMLQGGFTLLEQHALEKLIPQCRRKGVTINIAGAFCSGVLALGSKAGGYFHYKKADKKILNKIEEIENIGKSNGISLREMAINFPLLEKTISSVVIGCQNTNHVVDNIRDYNKKIPSYLWEELKKCQIRTKQV